MSLDNESLLPHPGRIPYLYSPGVTTKHLSSEQDDDPDTELERRTAIVTRILAIQIVGAMILLLSAVIEHLSVYNY